MGVGVTGGVCEDADGTAVVELPVEFVVLTLLD